MSALKPGGTGVSGSVVLFRILAGVGADLCVYGCRGGPVCPPWEKTMGSGVVVLSA